MIKAKVDGIRASRQEGIINRFRKEIISIKYVLSRLSQKFKWHTEYTENTETTFGVANNTEK